MDFIQTTNKQVDKFGAGKHGFSAGNPSGGIPATFLSSEWHDNVQQELVNVIEGASIDINPASKTQLLQAIQAMISASAGRLLRVTVFSTPGTTTWTAGAGTKSVEVEVIAGGGGGGGTITTGAGQGSASSGGSSGSYSRKFIANVASPQTVTVGAGGAAGATGGYGGAGGSSSFGALVSTYGGNPGIPGAAGSTTFVAGAAGAGAGSSGDINVPGMPTLSAMTVSAAPGPNSTTSNGANSIYGSGGLAQLNAPGLAASGYGAGGGGNSIGASTAGQVGGAGAPGVVIIKEYA